MNRSSLFVGAIAESFCMKKIILLFAFLLLNRGQLFAEISATTNELFLAVAGYHSISPIRFDERLVWLPFCNTGEVTLNGVSPEHGVKIMMWDESGKPVSRTALGESYGSKWDQLHSYKDASIYTVLAGGPYAENHDLGGGKFLPPPKDLFQMDQPGVYTLEIQMQMFRHVASSDASEWTRNLIRFPPVRLKVEKPIENR